MRHAMITIDYEDYERGFIGDSEDREYLRDDVPTEEIELTEVIR